MYPKKLQNGDSVRIIAPSNSLAFISEPTREIANRRLQDLGLSVTFGKHVEELDEFSSSSIASRISDLHEAFADPSIKAVFAVIGGYNANQLLSSIDWDLIRNNPKIFIGYSDTTVLQNAFFVKTGLVTYSGPAYSTFGQKLYFEYTLKSFKRCLMEEDPFSITPTDLWTDDAWYLDQNDRHPIKNEGWYAISDGSATGTILGGNLSTFRLLQGTEFFPDLTDSILFLEDDDASTFAEFDRSFQALVHTPGFDKVRGIVLGRFQNKSKMSRQNIERFILNRKELSALPVLANVDFGHTSPIFTFPIGGKATMQVNTEGSSSITITEH
ncbi:LD-carboxypeptidase [Patescibacteria group bacterium]|nr:LD-carboxypeptidase [Patescibacteria group bacterium]